MTFCIITTLLPSLCLVGVVKNTTSVVFSNSPTITPFVIFSFFRGGPPFIYAFSGILYFFKGISHIGSLVSIHLYTYVHTHLKCIHIHIHINLHIHIQIYIYIHFPIYTYAYLYIHTHTHTCNIVSKGCAY